MRELATLRPESLDADPEWLDNHPSPDEDHPDAVTDWLADFAANNPTPRFTLLYALPDTGSALIPRTSQQQPDGQCLGTRHLRCLVATLIVVQAREVTRRIERLGGEAVRQTGSHRRYRATAGDITAFTTVPQHQGRDIKTSTLHSIEKDLAPVFGEGWLR